MVTAKCTLDNAGKYTCDNYAGTNCAQCSYGGVNQPCSGPYASPNAWYCDSNPYVGCLKTPENNLICPSSNYTGCKYTASGYSCTGPVTGWQCTYNNLQGNYAGYNCLPPQTNQPSQQITPNQNPGVSNPPAQENLPPASLPKAPGGLPNGGLDEVLKIIKNLLELILAISGIITLVTITTAGI